ncbi:MAG: peptidoglycan binding protein CsiV [Gammaproteobacteria bacterium]|nr:peptidoglycan binding protein CsiV [Gammaproteobacteria bacterium]
MTRTTLTFPFILLSTLLSTPGSAQAESDKEDRWFQTEIIVFEVREKNTIDSQEIWPDDPGLPNYENSIELSPFMEAELQGNINPVVEESPLLSTPEISENRLETDNNTPKLLMSTQTSDLAPSETPHSTPVTESLIEAPPQEQPFQLLPDEALSLTKLTEILTGSTSYVPILNIAWRQPVASKEAAQTIYIHSNMEQITLAATPDLTSINTLMAPAVLNHAPVLLVAQNEAGMPSRETLLKTLTGTIKIHLGRYLHLEADLLYRSQIEPLKNSTFFMNFDEIEQPQTLFRMHQKRRLRSGELHYFDHPMFGMLVKIIPYELPEPVIELKDNTESDAALIEESIETNGTAVQ